VLYHERVMLAEETLLEERFGAQFVAWANETPAVIPHLRRWRKPTRPFALRDVLGREYHGLLAVVAIFAVLEVAGDWIVTGRLTLDAVWMVLLAFGLVSYVALFLLKRYTNLLTVHGRPAAAPQD
jgi:hypothetical protein